MSFEEIFASYIKREGSEELLKWLKSTDFFTAPGSTRFHDCHEGGLAQHSANVFNELVRLLRAYQEVKVTAETAAIVALLHDVCKAGCYKTEMRNRKNEFGEWEKYPVYTFKEDFAFGGHGSKSVYLIQKFMKLTDEEAVCINCHMGVENGNFAVNDAYREYPLAFLVHTADMASTIDFK
jgi:hypothetical protein